MKAVVTLGWNKYVMELDDAVTVVKALSNAEQMQDKYISAAESPTGSGFTKYFIFPQEEFNPTISFLTDDRYNIGKLAGKPE